MEFHQKSGGKVDLRLRRQAAEDPGGARDARRHRRSDPTATWQKEFEEAFPYKETADQFRAINETKADMESARPMDRLICGDVGFGKTEVAIRAAFKAAA